MKLLGTVLLFLVTFVVLVYTFTFFGMRDAGFTDIEFKLPRSVMAVLAIALACLAWGTRGKKSS